MILVIGGSGFVGSRLIDLIGKNNCLNIDKSESYFYNDITTIGNITNEDQITIDKRVKVVVLLAAEHADNVSPKSLYYNVNVEGTINVLKKMETMNIKNLVFTSSVAVYGLNKENPDETHPVDPFNDYGKSKFMAEKEILKWYKRDTTRNVSIIRPTVIFGERNRGNVYNLINQIASGNFAMVGNGNNKKSMAYVGNICEFIYFLVEQNNSGYNIYNYSDKPDYTMNSLVNLIEKKMGISIMKFKIPYHVGMIMGYFIDLISYLFKLNFKISSVRVKKFCATTQYNSSLAHKIFNPSVSLEEGLNKTLNFEFIDTKNDDDVLFYSE